MGMDTAPDLEERPWGNYRVLHRQPGIQVKRIEVKPGLRFSLQRHLRRTEKWVVIEGQGLATLGDAQLRTKKGDLLEVPCGLVHRLQNTGTVPLVFIEVQFGEYLGEDDIIRLEDDFKRT